MKEIFHRTSIRKYEKRKVEEDKIKRLLRAAMAAPSAGNQQPWEFYVVTARGKLEQLSQCSPYARMLKEAPLGIVVCCQKDCRLPDYAQIDCSAAVENLLLEADFLGLGAVWLGIAPLEDRMKAVGEVLEISPNLYAFFLFRLIRSPYPIHTQKGQTAQSPANRIEQQVVHIKTAHFGHKLYRLHHQAEFKTQKCSEQKRPAFPMQNRQKKSKGNKCDHIPHKIQQHRPGSKQMAIFDKTSDFLEQLQVIMVGSALKSTSGTLCKK